MGIKISAFSRASGRFISAAVPTYLLQRAYISVHRRLSKRPELYRIIIYVILYNSGGTRNCLTHVLRANNTYLNIMYMHVSPSQHVVCACIFRICLPTWTREGGWKKTQRAIHLPLRTALYYYALWWWVENKIRDRFTNVELNIMNANPTVVFFYRSVWQTFRTLSNV